MRKSSHGKRGRRRGAQRIPESTHEAQQQRTVGTGHNFKRFVDL